MSVLTSIPTGGFVGATHSGAAGIGLDAAVFPVGMKIVAKQDAATGVTAGFCTFVYYQFDNGSAITPAAKGFAHLLNGESAKLTYDVSAGNKYGPGVVLLGVITDAYYGFAQCGGPIADSTSMFGGSASPIGGAYVTDGNVAAGGSNATTTEDTLVGAITDHSGWVLSDTADTSNAIDSEFLYLIDKFGPSL